MARWVGIGKAVGYALLGVATVLVVTGLATSLTGALTGAAAACLIAGAVVLAPSIVLGYAVRAAERDDRARGL